MRLWANEQRLNLSPGEQFGEANRKTPGTGAWGCPALPGGEGCPCFQRLCFHKMITASGVMALPSMSSVPTVALSPPLASVIISDQRARKTLVLNTGFLFKVPVLLIHTLFFPRWIYFPPLQEMYGTRSIIA